MARSLSGTRSLLAMVAVVAACSRTNDDSRAQIDSLLARDLTLAASAAPPAMPSAFGDTAVSAVNAARPTATAPVKAPAKARPQAQSPQGSRPAPPVAARRPEQRVERTSVPQPNRTPVPTTAVETPVTTVPAPATTSPATGTSAAGSGSEAATGRARGIGAGAVLAGRTTQEVCSLANRPGDRFVVTLANDVVGTGGARLPAGTPVLVELATTPEEGQFGFRVKAVQVDGDLVSVQGDVRAEGAMTERRVSTGGDKGKVVGGAVVGAILGKVLGGSTKDVVIGAAGGAAAGTIAAARSGKVERCLPAGSTITVTLSSPIALASGIP